MKELLLRFFKNEDFAGWKNIAECLIEKGECIVAGEKSIYNGGINNFIKTSKTIGAIGCTTYKFDLKYFKSSKWFQENLKAYIIDKKAEHLLLEAKLSTLRKEIRDCINQLT